jgi:hypothetical protein
MRPRSLILLPTTLVACTSVTGVTVAPDQLRILSDMGPNEERDFVPREAKAEKMVAQGDDEIRLLVASPPAPPGTEEPWGKLYTLHLDGTANITPTSAPGRPDLPVRVVPLNDVTGAELELVRPDAGKTAALVVAIVLVSAFIAGSVVVVLNAQKKPQVIFE